jgi:protein SCO1/2
MIGALLWGPMTSTACADALPQFALENWDGTTVSTETLKGTRTILVFTYAKCVLACPLVTRQLKDLDTDLGSPADLRFLHVSVNPTEDTPTEIVAHFEKHDIDPRKDPRWLFVGGTEREVATVLETFGVKVTRRPVDGGIFVEHTIKVLVVDPTGEITETFGTYHWDRKEMLDALESNAS